MNAQQNKGTEVKTVKNNMLDIHKSYMNNDSLKDRFNSILGENSASYMASVLNIIKASDKLMECEPVSIWNAALCSAAMHLPLDTGLGYAFVVPYKDNKKKIQVAQFQIGAKGYHQLALRTGEYITIASTDVREGEIKRRNRLTGQIEFCWYEDDEKRITLPIIGYVSYFQLRNGFSSTLYMSMEELMEHARKYSKLYQNDLKYGSKSSKWSIPEERDAMCKKTVSKLNLSRNGVLSIEMQNALKCDNAVINDNGEPEYIDRSENDTVLPDKSLADSVNMEFADVFNTATGEITGDGADEPAPEPIVSDEEYPIPLAPSEV